MSDSSKSCSLDLKPETGCTQKSKEKTHTTNVLKSLGYQVVDHLGEGGFGEVKLATAERHPKPVAIKILKYRNSEEIAILKTVRHPNIIQVHEIFEMPNGNAFIVMEAAEMDLESRAIKEIPIDKIRLWFFQLLSAVDYLHQQGIAHRDLKCCNVLLTADSQAKLTDFGIGCFFKYFPDLCDTYPCTPEYAAPEVLNQIPYDPKKSDVWSLGLILHEMLTGRLPYECTSDLPLSEPCRSIIQSMLQHEPSDRPSVNKLLQHPWLQSTAERSDKSLERPARVQEDDDADQSKVEYHGCLNFAAVKRAAKALVAPIVRAFRPIRKNMSKIFSRDKVVQDADHSAGRLKFPKFKVCVDHSPTLNILNI
uniref:non-specific serine/threonine protein kinase n=1 Tax=Astyanax mexicanus TaxID=7994 RepID=A0A3B1J8A9_ASTMX